MAMPKPGPSMRPAGPGTLTKTEIINNRIYSLYKLILHLQPADPVIWRPPISCKVLTPVRFKKQLPQYPLDLTVISGMKPSDAI